MNPVDFPESNRLFGPPADMDESQVRTVPAFVGTVRGGSIDGSVVVVTCWQPTAEDLAKLAAGSPIFLTFIGGLPPHSVNLDFQDATNFA